MTGDEIKAWRKRHGIGMRELGRLLGVQGSTIARWEKGERHTMPVMLERALKHIECERKEP